MWRDEMQVKQGLNSEPKELEQILLGVLFNIQTFLPIHSLLQ